MKLKNLLLIATTLTLTACSTQKAQETTFFQWTEQNAHNGATIQDPSGMGILNLGSNDGYYDLEAGQTIKDLQDYSISIRYYVDSINTLDGYGHFLFAFSKLAENKADEGPYMAMRLNEQRFEVSTGGWNHEEFIMQGGQPERNVWHHALYRQKGKSGELYLDGSLIGRNDNMPILSDIFAEAPACCWIGRAPFNGDKYLTDTQVADFRIFHYALSDEEMAELK